ncbi:AlkA N-terminal domain-containing protein [Undibacterium sp. SXout7W]|uniref:AlkA N-terminal domain-containing protein n=1 Tax=Undibacterium sp. SXout7W TaxID=3413049 RepID=UPI003BF31088
MPATDPLRATTKSHSAQEDERDQRYFHALAARDSRFDGVFFTGVTTTGIYCRPVCPAKTPRASSCHFFSTAAAAEAAGFRPCLRCRPELAPYAIQQNLAHAVWQKIADGALNEGNLETLAAQVGLSSRQLRRVVLQEFGVTPVTLAQTQRLLFAKRLLQETSLSMTDIAYASGFGSVRRFNALFADAYQLTPGSLRRISAQTSDSIQLRLAYRPPFAWDALISYLAGRAMPGLEAILHDKGQASYVRSVTLDGRQGWIKISHLPERQQLALHIAPELTPVLMPLMARVRQQFDLEANPAVIQSILQASAMLNPQIQRTPGLRVPGAFDGFELAIRAVLGQQVSVAGATTVSGRLVQRFGEAFQTPFANVTHHFPTPAVIAALPLDQLAGIGVPGARAATLQHLARFTLEGGLQRHPGASVEEAVAQLKTVKGIGEWTAQYIAMRALRYPNAFPAGDLGLQKAAAQLSTPTMTRLTEKQLLTEAQAWAPWRSYAAVLLWQSLSVHSSVAHLP